MLSNTKLFFIGVFLCLSLLFLLRYQVIGQAVYGDGIYYYAYTRSMVKDFDLNFRNELQHRYSPIANNTLEEINPDSIKMTTDTDHVPNKYPIGPGIFWLPGFMAADTFANTLSIFIKGFPNNGYSDLYQVVIGVNSVLYATIGLYFLFLTLRLFISRGISYLTIIAVALGSNLFYYSALDVINSHSLSFMFGSIYFYVLFCDKSKYKSTKLGALSGILALIRTQDAVFLLFTFISIIRAKEGHKKIFISFLLSILAFSLFFLPQLISWKIIYGHFLALPYLAGGEGFNFLNPQLIGVLFNLKSGLFIWTPFYLISIIGAIRFYRRFPKIGIIFILIQMLLISSWSGWNQGESFGVRMLISTLPLFAIGFAHILDQLNVRGSMLLVMSLVVFNFTAIVYFLLIVQSPTFDMDTITQDRILSEFRLFR